MAVLLTEGLGVRQVWLYCMCNCNQLQIATGTDVPLISAHPPYTWLPCRKLPPFHLCSEVSTTNQSSDLQYSISSYPLQEVKHQSLSACVCVRACAPSTISRATWYTLAKYQSYHTLIPLWDTVHMRQNQYIGQNGSKTAVLDVICSLCSSGSRHTCAWLEVDFSSQNGDCAWGVY
jgi:hypothetical protein